MLIHSLPLLKQGLALRLTTLGALIFVLRQTLMIRIVLLSFFALAYATYAFIQCQLDGAPHLIWALILLNVTFIDVATMRREIEIINLRFIKILF